MQITSPDHVWYGSDFPYAPLASSIALGDLLTKLTAEDEFKGFKKAYTENADALFGGIAKHIVKQT